MYDLILSLFLALVILLSRPSLLRPVYTKGYPIGHPMVYPIVLSKSYIKSVGLLV
jgi:hypothetical protein